jgi:putative PEP-CTERM system histidine kinase
MNSAVILSFFSAFSAVILAIAVVIYGKRTAANWLFFFGIITLSLDALFSSVGAQSVSAEMSLAWENASFITKSLLPGIWLSFSLAYSRGNYREFFARWRFVMAGFFCLPLLLVIGFYDSLILSVEATDSRHPIWLVLGASGKGIHIVLLAAAVLVLMNLEKTFRTAVGTMRWRIKFVVLGLCVIFGVRVYASAQVLLYSGMNLSMPWIESVALLIGCILIGISYIRSGRTEIDVYPSQAFLYNSIAMVIAGVYLVVIGLLARLVAEVGGDSAFPIKAFLLLVALVLLALAMLSDRLRQKTRRFISRHLQRPLYDYRGVWKSFTEGTISKVEERDLCDAVARFISGIFQLLSVTIWLVEREKQKLVFGASTSLQAAEGTGLTPDASAAAAIIHGFQQRAEAIDLETAKEPWTETLRRCTPGEFRKGGHRTCIPIIVSGELIGLITLGDRVAGIPLNMQDLDLLKCIADQTAACLRNIQLSRRLMQAKEMEAFQTMSAFFVHDLKNTASTLSLMLKNLPVHFNDPAFREDALRGISNTVNHINSLIGRLSMLRQELAIQPAEADINELITKTLKDLNGTPDVNFITDLSPIQRLRVDPEQIQKVLLNLFLNAKEALNRGGEIKVKTNQENSWTVVSVTDNGCGMSPEFIERSLFRPFQTTKKRGIGIGMFQSKMIVEAHGGRIEVQSKPGVGTTFRLLLPSQPIISQ